MFKLIKFRYLIHLNNIYLQYTIQLMLYNIRIDLNNIL